MKNFLIQFIIVSCLLISCTKEAPIIEQPLVPSDGDYIKRVKQDVFKYFYNYAHPNSKLTKERLHEDDLAHDPNTIAMGGSGFGLLNILMGIDNQFISREAGINHLNTALNFLASADRFHGAWSHWIDGNSGKVIPFSTLDDGGDIMETALLCQSLICIREYFKNGTPQEQGIAQKADELWKGVDWNWYTKGENVLYWHWSPNVAWQMNFQIRGYNEGLIAYIMAASSPTNPISAAVYHQGWAQSGAIVSNASQYNMPVIFKHNGANGHVGPLFWAHYSYLTLDPRGLQDRYANYWDLVKNHTKIIYQFCIENPHNYAGYSQENWGLTASYSRNADGSTGYAAHQPNHDKGVITPTAALSSIAYTPEESLQFLRFVYAEPQKNYIGMAGPYDAFSIHYDWVTPRYLAIDQGTIGPMMENYQTQFFWNLFMNAPDIQNGLKKLDFSSSLHGF